MVNWTVPEYNFTKQTIVLGGRQFTRCIPLFKGQNRKSGRIICVWHVYFKRNFWRQIGWRVNQPFKYTFFFINSEVNSTMRRCFFIIQTSDRICFFLALFKPIILLFFTILQDKLHSFNIQDDRSTHFLCKANYSLIQRFHEENSMPGLMWYAE